MSDNPFRGRQVVLTGTASGIGRALALALARRGARLAISDVNMAGLEDTAAAARALGATVRTDRLDVAERTAFEAYAADLLAAGPVDLIVNNAGVALLGDIAEVSYQDMDWLMGINFWGVVHGTKAFLPAMLARGQGGIVNISSLFGLIGMTGNGPYCAAKFAVRGFTETLRQEVAPKGLYVGCVHPGGIKTAIAASARVGQLPKGVASREEVAKLFDQVAHTTPERAAEIILTGIARRNPRILIGKDAKFLSGVQRLFPVGYAKLILRRGNLADLAKTWPVSLWRRQ